MTFLRIFAIAVLIAGLASVPGRSTAQDEAAGIFTGAKALYAAAQTKAEEERVEDYRGIRRLLDLIVESHPSSDLAVRILLQDTIEGVDVAAIDAALAASEPAAPAVQADDVPPAPVQIEETSPQPQMPPRPEKEIVIDVQTELNRLGCAAGTPDGVAGRNTRAAFARFIAETGADFTEDDLATEAAVAALQAREDQVCEVRTMASTPASALSGSWGFRSACPGFGSRVIRNEGRMSLSYVGSDTLRGTARNQQGISGPAVIQFQGGRTAATVIRFGFVTLRGNLLRSTSNMTISGTGSNRCRIVAWKN